MIGGERRKSTAYHADTELFLNVFYRRVQRNLSRSRLKKGQTMTSHQPQKISRRTVLRSGAASAAALTFAPTVLRAQNARVRKNMMSEGGLVDLRTYGEGVAEMLNLPLSDGRNWYRQGFVHFIDCPHGNWWFTSWHRGYLGYFEEIIRELTGKEDFMLPYWDWTEAHKVPAPMFGRDNPLDPVNFRSSAVNYIATNEDFQEQVRPVMQDFWNSMTPAQKAEQDKRSNTDFDVMWATKDKDNATYAFQDREFARFLTEAYPMLDARTQNMVELGYVLGTLAPTEFAGPFKGDDPFFENSVTDSHQVTGDFSGLSSTHNMVHNSTGGSEGEDGKYEEPYGIMTNNLSPLDPIFFLHHCNIDRLWDVWTRKQQALGLPIAPEGDLLDPYKKEQYLFFFDRTGDPVGGNPTSWDFFDTSAFEYSYQPGSGEQAVPPKTRLAKKETVASALAVAPAGRFAASADAVVSGALARSIARPKDSTVHLATVRFLPPADSRGKVFDLYVSPKGQPPVLGVDSPEFAGSFSFFGQAHSMETGFTVPIDAVLDRMADGGLLTEGAELSFSLVLAGGENAEAASVEDSGALQSVSVHVFSEG
ncbi:MULTISPECIES: tyrosinase family protein [unclassified Marinovum]